jgi:hypothetical protein
VRGGVGEVEDLDEVDGREKGADAHLEGGGQG